MSQYPPDAPAPHFIHHFAPVPTAVGHALPNTGSWSTVLTNVGFMCIVLGLAAIVLVWFYRKEYPRA